MAFSIDLAHTLIGICGNITALILFLSPLPTMVQIVKKKSVLQYKAAPYLATLFNCGLWVLYGLPMVHPNSILVLTINGVGFVIEFCYLVLFFIFSDKKGKLQILLIVFGVLAFIAALGAFDILLFHSYKIRSTIVGSIAVLGGILMYAAPLSVMKLVISTKSVEYMPLFLSVCSFINAFFWTVYGLLKIDPFLLGTNVVGLLLAVAQLVLYAIYNKKSNNVSSEVNMVDMEKASSNGTP